MRILFCAALAALAVSAASCSKDDDNHSDPEGTVSLNMLDEQNGKTVLEDSGIYIDKAQNFVANGNCDLFVLGKSGGLGGAQVKSFDTPVSQAAVQTGYAYAACRPQALMRFPSGKLALPIGNSDVNFMKMYVVSQLKDGEKTVGAVVKYALLRPQTNGLPEPEGRVLTISPDNFVQLDQEVPLKLSTADFEYKLMDDGYSIACEKRGRQLVFTLGDWLPDHTFTLYLRIGVSYAKVYVRTEGLRR